MEDWAKHPALVITALVTAVIGSVINITMGIDPNARPDPFTGTEGRALSARVQQLEQHHQQLEAWRDAHVQWGYELAGRRDAQIQELYRLCEKP